MIYTTEYEFRPGRVRIEGKRIAEVEFCAEGELSRAERETLVLPGLVDVHFHGAESEIGSIEVGKYAKKPAFLIEKMRLPPLCQKPHLLQNFT